MSLQVAILKVLASHDSGRATLASLNRDIAVLTASGAEWSARIKRLAARVAAIDIFGCGFVLRDHEGWQITTAGREFLAALEAITQDNQPPAASRPAYNAADAVARPQGGLIVVGARFRNRIHRRRGTASRNAKAAPDQLETGPREETASKSGNGGRSTCDDAAFPFRPGSGQFLLQPMDGA